jgi:O-antigen ligase
MAEGMREWQENLLLGIGPNMYPVQSRTLQSGTRTLEGQHAHNLLLTLGAEQGLVGLAAIGLFVVAAVAAFRVGRRFALGRDGANPHRVPLGAAVTLSATAALITMVGAGLVDYPLRNAMTRTTAWMFLGLVLAGQRCAISGTQRTAAASGASGGPSRSSDDAAGVSRGTGDHAERGLG